MFEIILLAYLSFRNSVRARVKGLNPWLWAGITILSFLAAFMVGSMIVIFNFCSDTVNLQLLSSMDPKDKELVTRQLIDTLNNNPLRMFTIELFGIGGYLLIRYILEKKPNKKTPEIHWMDKLEQ